MAILRQGVNTGHRENPRDVLVVKYMLNEYMMDNGQRLLSPREKEDSEILLAIEWFQLQNNIKPTIRIENQDRTYIALHKAINESYPDDKPWELGGVEYLKEEIRYQHELTEYKGALSAQTAHEKEVEAQLRRFFASLGGYAYIAEQCTICGVHLSTAYVRMVQFFSNLPAGKPSELYKLVKQIIKGQGFPTFLRTIAHPTKGPELIARIKRIKGFGIAAVAILTLIAVADKLYRGEYTDAFTDIGKAIYSVAFWQVAVAECIEVVFDPWFRNSRIWRFVKTLNPARHLKVVLDCAVTMLHIGFRAINGEWGRINSILNDMLVRFESDETLVEINKTANDAWDALKRLAEGIADVPSYFWEWARAALRMIPSLSHAGATREYAVA